ncbi:hypothetical protein MASR1M8_06670 [Thermomonas brevis]
MSAMPTGSRAEAQRERILAAAHKCFAERGFHAASMASIAETAEMSPGLIYRYFGGKSEIIQGIVKQQLALMAADLEARRGQLTDLPGLLLESYGQCADARGEAVGLEPGLVLEIAAEASRDPLIAEAMQELDRTLQTRIQRWLATPVSEGGVGVPKEEVPARALALRLVIDGLKMRQAHEPEPDLDLLRQALRIAVDGAMGVGAGG